MWKLFKGQFIRWLGGRITVNRQAGVQLLIREAHLSPEAALMAYDTLTAWILRQL